MSWAGRIRNALQPGRVDREIEKELAFHLTEKIEGLRAAGLSETEAFRKLSGNWATGHTRRKGRGTWISISEWKRRCGTSATLRGGSGTRRGSRRP